LAFGPPSAACLYDRTPRPGDFRVGGMSATEPASLAPNAPAASLQPSGPGPPICLPRQRHEYLGAFFSRTRAAPLPASNTRRLTPAVFPQPGGFAVVLGRRSAGPGPAHPASPPSGSGVRSGRSEKNGGPAGSGFELCRARRRPRWARAQSPGPGLRVLGEGLSSVTCWSLSSMAMTRGERVFVSVARWPQSTGIQSSRQAPLPVVVPQRPAMPAAVLRLRVYAVAKIQLIRCCPYLEQLVRHGGPPPS